MPNTTIIEQALNTWQWGWESLDVISSIVLSVLLIGFTIWIAYRQNKIQKQIADRDIKSQNYQHRIRCYSQIINASTIMTKAHGFSLGNIFQGTPIPPIAINDLDNGARLMLKAQLEAKLVFSEKLAKMIYKMFDDYSEYAQQFSMFFINRPQIHESLKEIGFENFLNSTKDISVIQRIKAISPELASLIMLNNKLAQQFKSEEFNNLLLKETKAE